MTGLLSAVMSFGGALKNCASSIKSLSTRSRNLHTNDQKEIVQNSDAHRQLAESQESLESLRKSLSDLQSRFNSEKKGHFETSRALSTERVLLDAMNKEATELRVDLDSEIKLHHNTRTELDSLKEAQPKSIQEKTRQIASLRTRNEKLVKTAKSNEKTRNDAVEAAEQKR